MDCEQGVIDFSLYLRSNHQNNNIVGDTPDSDVEYDNMSTVLDQKNYIEELNRHLKLVSRLYRLISSPTSIIFLRWGGKNAADVQYFIFCSFSATVANLQSQVEALTTTNALMKEDLEITKGNVITLMQENTILKAQKGQKQSLKQKKDVSLKFLFFLD